jgi:hypothetical protein
LWIQIIVLIDGMLDMPSAMPAIGATVTPMCRLRSRGAIDVMARRGDEHMMTNHGDDHCVAKLSRCLLRCGLAR